jgi:hypothetical protein
MATWTTPTTHVTGDTLAVSDWNALANDASFLYAAPYGLYYNSSTTSVGTGTTQVTLGGTTASGYSFSVSSNNVVVPIAGIYTALFAVQTVIGAVGTNSIQALVYYNGSSITLAGSAVTTYIPSPASSGGGCVKCAASATLGLYIYNAATLLTTYANAATTFLHAFYVGST